MKLTQVNIIGTMRWRQGDMYKGEFKDGLRHGSGLYTSKVFCARFISHFLKIYNAGKWHQVRG